MTKINKLHVFEYGKNFNSALSSAPTPFVHEILILYH